MTSLLVVEGHDGQNEQMFKENFLNGNGATRINGNDAHAVNGGGVHINGNGAHPINGNGAVHANGNGASHDRDHVVVRHYKPEDREAIRQICCDTGFLGNPIETIFSDREIFADLFTNPYLDYGPNWAWVAEDGGKVVGYLLGSISASFNYTLMYSGFQTTVKMIKRAATGCYAGHPRSRHFIRWLLTSGYREQPKHPENAAHLHLNVEKSHRGRGLGLRLWQAFEQQLETSGIRTCYGAFFSRPRRRPEAVYSKLGFSVFDRKATTIFQPEISEPVEIVCVHRKVA
ncbi:MAG TPA: GNAT family N-acetyltransferase [Candidatus Sulfotelmatobacter sp.]|nr:GNAT family N-acetyltransferase [Candidatus Sulfotelmatobacter sp.]